MRFRHQRPAPGQSWSRDPKFLTGQENRRADPGQARWNRPVDNSMDNSLECAEKCVDFFNWTVAQKICKKMQVVVFKCFYVILRVKTAIMDTNWHDGRPFEVYRWKNLCAHRDLAPFDAIWRHHERPARKSGVSQARCCPPSGQTSWPVTDGESSKKFIAVTTSSAEAPR